MSLSMQHQEWLQLLEISGPFLAMPVIARAFPQGLERIDAATKRELRLAHQEWLDSHSNEEDSRKYHFPWIKYVLKNLLEIPTELILENELVPSELAINLPEHGELLKPDMVVMPPSAPPESSPRILITVFPAKQKLDRSLLERTKWNASPATRMMEMLKRTAVRVGIVTNGEHWLLVYSPESDTTSFVGWYASVWMEEELTVRSFRSLLSAYRFFGVPEADTLEALFRASTEFQHEVTTQLGGQVRRAIEQLVQALDQIDKDSGRALLRDVSEAKLYEAGVSVMMRLVFLLSAEERELFPINNPVYRDNYAVLTLREQLEQLASRHGEEVLERRYDAWNRLLATFRAIYAGVRHEDFNLQAYGGSLFDPDRYPFLEGRAPETLWYETNVVPLSVNDRTVLHLLDSLQLLRGTGTKSEARKLSFRALDVEQIGHVYESLLEHTAVRAADLVLGLEGAQGKEPEVPISTLHYQSTLGKQELLNWLHDETGKSTNALSNLLKRQDRYPDYKVRAVCDNNEALYTSVKPFVGLVREDSQNMPVVFTAGSVYVTEGTERRSTGTHYTPRSLTEPIAQHTLDPLLYAAIPEGSPPSIYTLRSPREILELKICDMTCGSGAFLVQACRYLAERLLESWNNCREVIVNGGEIDIYGQPVITEIPVEPKFVVPKDPNDALFLARRLIADRCLYGVDCNPMAVEMAKLSLWLTTLQKDIPFTFLDHAIKCGDSLIGVHTLRQLEHFSLSPKPKSTPTFLATQLTSLLEGAGEKRLKLETMLAGDICDTDVKAGLHRDAEDQLATCKRVANILTATTLNEPVRSNGKIASLETAAVKLAGIIAQDPSSPSYIEFVASLEAQTLANLPNSVMDFQHRKPFHWLFEFPEVFFREVPGFDAIVGNPPFMGGQKITGSLGTAYRDCIVTSIAMGKRGSADLCAYFFLRAHQLLQDKGMIGLLATNTISEGDTRQVGLDQVCATGGAIIRAIKSSPWPGTASLEVAHVWLYKGPWTSGRTLDNQSVKFISTNLVESDAEIERVYKLKKNKNKSFQGSIVLGMGFILTHEEMDRLISKNSSYKQVLFPYLNADDVNSQINQSASRAVINFFDFPIARDALGNWNTASDKQRREWLSEGIVPPDYPGMTASDFPDCLQIVADKVKPERTRTDDKGAFVLRYPLYKKWWIYAEKRPALYTKIQSLERVLVVPLVSKYLIVTWQQLPQVFAHKLAVIATDEDAYLAILQSTIHEVWARANSSTLETRMNYAPSDCFESFPFPESTDSIHTIGAEYHQLRAELSKTFNEGLTKLYNRFHSEIAQDTLTQQLRDLHVEMDNVVLTNYGWSDIRLDHEFRDTNQGKRFAVSEECRRQILARLRALNKHRYEQELSEGPMDENDSNGNAKKGKVRKRASQ